MNKYWRPLRDQIINTRIRRVRSNAEKKLRANTALWETLQSYLERSTSTGGEFTDYLALYNHVRQHRPTEILECGTGVSTVVMAQALMENEAEYGIIGRITSMEDKEQWFKVAKNLLPPDFDKYVDLVLSPRIADGWYLFRGMRYETIPDRPYEFVFVDGPDFDAPNDGHLTFDFDLIRVIEKSTTPVYAIIDDRLSTSFVMQQVVGTGKAKYKVNHRLCFVGPCTKEDLRGMQHQKPCFSHSFSIFGISKLSIELKPLVNRST